MGNIGAKRWKVGRSPVMVTDRQIQQAQIRFSVGSRPACEVYYINADE